MPLSHLVRTRGPQGKATLLTPSLRPTLQQATKWAGLCHGPLKLLDGTPCRSQAPAHLRVQGQMRLHGAKQLSCVNRSPWLSKGQGTEAPLGLGPRCIWTQVNRGTSSVASQQLPHPAAGSPPQQDRKGQDEADPPEAPPSQSCFGTSASLPAGRQPSCSPGKACAGSSLPGDPAAET